MVVAKSAAGEFAIMDGHAPLLAGIGDAPLRIKAGEGETVLACFGGTLRVGTEGGVEVLVEDAIPVDEIDLAAVKRRLSTLEEGDETTKRRLALLERLKEGYA